jgi:hypothetical protein
MRIMQTVHWQGKNYPMPFDVKLRIGQRTRDRSSKQI